MNILANRILNLLNYFVQLLNYLYLLYPLLSAYYFINYLAVLRLIYAV